MRGRERRFPWGFWPSHPRLSGCFDQISRFGRGLANGRNRRITADGRRRAAWVKTPLFKYPADNSRSGPEPNTLRCFHSSVTEWTPHFLHPKVCTRPVPEMISSLPMDYFDAYLNSGSILRLFLVPPGSTILSSIDFNVS